MARSVGYWIGRHPVWTMLLGLFFIGILSNALLKENRDSTQKQPSANPSGTQPQEASLPKIPPPKFRVFKFKTNVPTSYVVPVNTTDEQLKSLLWFFRQKVRAGEFKAIGVTQPTSKQWGEYGYQSGMLLVYRGEKCANEGYISPAELDKGNLGPCGYGEHDDAYYWWGIDGDPNKDIAGIRGKNGNSTDVFDYKDNWHPSSEVLHAVDQKVKDEWEPRRKDWESRQRIAVLISNELFWKGTNIEASANQNQPTQLDLRSPLFKNTSFREAFIKDLPQMRHDLCNLRFERVRILQESESDTGQIYPLHCR